MKRTVQWGVVLATALALAGAVQADDVSNKIGLSGLAAASFPLGDGSVMDHTDTVGHDFGGMFRLGLAKHISFGLSYDNLNLYAQDGERHHPEIFMANALYHLRPDEKCVPTLQLGVGAASTMKDSAFNNAAVRAGLGFDYFLNPAFAVGPQLSYTFLADGGTDGVDEYHVLNLGLMASVFFGGGTTEAAPVVAAAPVDSDGDGVMDPSDTCPGTAHGIPVDPNGCPKKIEEPVSLTLKVLFDTGKATVKRADYKTEIEQVANFLATYPDMTVEIEGHSDNTGSAEFNQRLSQERAGMVRTAIIKEFHIAPERITAVGYGQTKPIADNSTEQGRETNRRVMATLHAVKKVQ